jgi:hypothetical protein
MGIAERLIVATIADAIQTQLRNIEAQYGRSIQAWTDLIRASGLTRHGEIVAMLKRDHGMTHGSANRVALESLDRMRAPTSGSTTGGAPALVDPVDEIYAGDRAGLRPIHDRLMAVIDGLGSDVERAPKRGYLSLRRRTQFAMVKPAAKHVDLGLILPGVPPGERLESAGTFNAMFSHRVRVRSMDDVDPELIGWIQQAYERAG